jgi:hypothetical protein
MTAAYYRSFEVSLGLFDPSDSGQPTRYTVSLDLENEDSDWSFEVTVTMEF